MKHTLACLIQNRLGALDRVLGALTYRGFVPHEMVSTIDTQSGYTQVTVSFECDDAKTVDKLVKFLDKQVTVLEVCQLPPDSPPPSSLKTGFMTPPEPIKRRSDT